MAGKGGGGSWKVAYADFVTAMMAFFLVMWIGAQDQATRESVANYFIDPAGVSKKPSKTGSVTDSVTKGNLPQAEQVAMGRGRVAHSAPREPGRVTKIVSDWIHQDKKTEEYWRAQAQHHHDMASKSKEVLEKQTTPSKLAAVQLSKQMRDEFTRGIPTTAGNIYQEMLYGAAGDVNWTELAEDLLPQ